MEDSHFMDQMQYNGTIIKQKFKNLKKADHYSEIETYVLNYLKNINSEEIVLSDFKLDEHFNSLLENLDDNLT